MGLFRGSRYRFSETIQAEDADGIVQGIFCLRKTTVEVPEGSIAYTVGPADTFESLAFRYYGDGNKWYVIADVNPQVFFPLDLESGMLIYIPPRSYAALV